MLKELPDTERDNRKAIGDPHELISLFRESESYARWRTAFLKDKELASDVTERDIQVAFEVSPEAHNALIDFVEENPFVWNPAHYSEEAVEAIEEYIAYVKSIGGNIPENTSNADTKEVSLHNDVSAILKNDGIAGSEWLHRTIARLILVAEGVETTEVTRAMRPEPINSPPDRN